MASSKQKEILIACGLCELPFSGIIPCEQHIKRKKHKKQVEDQKKERHVGSVDGNSCLENTDAQDFTCDICGTAFSGIISYTQHLMSKPHAKFLRRRKAEDDTADLKNSGIDSELPDNDDDFNETLRKNLQESYGRCTIYKKQFGAPESYLQHMKSRSHEKRKSELHLRRKIKAIPGTCEVIDSKEVCENMKNEKGFEDAEGQEELKCKDCNKGFCGSLCFARHLISKSHGKRENRNKLLNELKAIKMKELEQDSSLSEEESSDVLKCEICSMSFCGPENLKAHIKSKGYQKALRWEKYLAKKEKSTEGGGRAVTNHEKKCKDCNEVFSGSLCFAKHLISKSHEKRENRNKLLNEFKTIKMKELEENSSLLEEESSDVLKCEICSISFCGPEKLKAHIKSKGHQKALRWEKYLAKKEKSTEGGGRTVTNHEKCNEVFSGSLCFAEHLISKSHEKRENRNKLLNELKTIKMKELEEDSSLLEEESSDALKCEICSISFCGPENLKAHIKSKGHQKALRWEKYLAKKEKSTEGGSRAVTNHEKKKDNKRKHLAKQETDSSSKSESTSEAIKANEPSIAAV